MEARLDRDVAGEIDRRPPFLDKGLLDAQDLQLVDVEVDVDGLELHEARELGGRTGTDEGAHVHEVRRHPSVEGCCHLSVAQIDLGELEIGLGLIDRRLGQSALRLPALDVGGRGGVLLGQANLPVVLGLCSVTSACCCSTSALACATFA